MRKRHSIKPNESRGTIYLIATPIGNLNDISYRMVQVLKKVDIVAAEDTRTARKLFHHIGLQNMQIRSYYIGNEDRETENLIDLARQGMNIALITESGTPCISDPGFLLVREAWKYGIKLIPIPGPSAVQLALIVSGFPSNSYTFLGFLPSKSTQRRKLIESLRNSTISTVVFESVHRIQATLGDFQEILPDREIFIARELTKEFETFYKGIAMNILEELVTRKELKGEFTLVIKGA
ncbi:MAG: 16S rRNA (cytidine(1402)-2'-O)-methyltransferase [Candidatus Coatesbacteria bacterium]|nr:16S rRNA (cytidine(1402)-2'-O)-methyltransferase [Candidatus Coatesbacteria bacterium]